MSASSIAEVPERMEGFASAARTRNDRKWLLADGEVGFVGR
jgi:phosphatidylserine/phosphatidylglycerophosphate/cardiolipin synthase-like enzyme